MNKRWINDELCFNDEYIERLHTHSVSVEIELKMNWQGCKQVLYFQAMH